MQSTCMPLYLCFTELNICNEVSREHMENRIRIIKHTCSAGMHKRVQKQIHAVKENSANVIWSVE